MSKVLGILLVCGLVHTASADIIPITTDGTYFDPDGSTPTVNADLVRVGWNNTVTFEFVGLLTFDLSAYSVAELQSSTYTLDFDLGVQDNAPALADLTIEYIGTVADATFSTANAGAWTAATTVNTIFSGAESAGVGKSYNADAISGDTFDNQYAVFRLTKSAQGNQWDVPNGTATLNVIPEPGTFALLGLGGSLILLARRRRRS